MKIYDVLKLDHKRVAGLFDKLDSTTERALKTRQLLFDELNNRLTIHATLEERFFYPVLQEAEETRDSALEAAQEHHIVKRLLRELADMAKDSEEWTAKLTVLRQLVGHHVEEEEHELFKKARQVLTDEQAEELGGEIEASRTTAAAAASR